MANDKTVQLQGALYRLLEGDSTLRALLTGVPGSPTEGVFQDRAPDVAVRPYVVIRDTSFTPFDTDDDYGQEFLFNIHVWANDNDTKGAKDIAARAYFLLHDKQSTFNILGSPSFSVMKSIVEFSDSFIDPDEHIVHEVRRVNIVVDDL